MGIRSAWQRLTSLPSDRASYTPTQVAELWDEACAARGLVRKVGIGETKREEWPSLGAPELVRDGLYIFAVQCPMGGQIEDIAKVAAGLAEDLEATHIEVLADNGLGSRRGRLAIDLRARPTGPLLWTPTGDRDTPYIWLGQTMNGKTLVQAVPGEREPAPHVLIAGLTGAGKTALTTIMMAGYLARGGVHMYLIDPGEVDAARWLDAAEELGDRQVFTGCALESKDWASVLRQVVEHAEANRRWIRSHRRSSLYQCRDLQGRPAPIVVFIDELHQVLTNKAAARLVWKLVKEHRKDGVMVVASTQTTGHRSVDTEIRANFAARSCGHLSQRSDVEVVMGSFADQTPAHLLPINSGQAFMISAGMSVPQRVQYAWLPDDQIPSVVERYAPRRAMPDPREGGGPEGGGTGHTPPFRPTETEGPTPYLTHPPQDSATATETPLSDEIEHWLRGQVPNDPETASQSVTPQRDEPPARVHLPDHPLARKRDGTVASTALALWTSLAGEHPRCVGDRCGKQLDWSNRADRQVIVVPVDGDRANLEPSNLAPMCRSCAGKHHGRRAA
ncbi:MAG: FtsK/SpoIIIE domain-containing protein [Actinomycetota bacterium]